jgi:hypothetical protein
VGQVLQRGGGERKVFNQIFKIEIGIKIKRFLENLLTPN